MTSLYLSIPLEHYTWIDNTEVHRETSTTHPFVSMFKHILTLTFMGTYTLNRSLYKPRGKKAFFLISNISYSHCYSTSVLF